MIAQRHTRTFKPTLNDVHAKLNATRVNQIRSVTASEDIVQAFSIARHSGRGISVAGGRHAMGGQQFGRDTIHLDMRGLDRVIEFDPQRGEIEVEAGIEWPALMLALHVLQRGAVTQWGIRQKQTGADRLSIGGAVAANIHGRGLRMKPFVEDIVSLTVVRPDGTVSTCGPDHNRPLFRLVVGGYGLFGVVTSVRLRLAPRLKVQRLVEELEVSELMHHLDERIAEGALYGDFQFNIDPSSDNFLTRGICSFYVPVETARPVIKEERRLSKADWKRLLYLAHTDKAEAFRQYQEFYLSTSGQLYWSDTHQLSIYLDDYHEELDHALGAKCPGSEMISELYVPRENLGAFLAEVARDFRRHEVDVIYGTVRFIEKDEVSYLAWAKQAYACVIFNLHTDHHPAGIDRSRRAFQRLIDIALSYGGSYFLTYHRFARRDQVLAAYPQFPAFLAEKERHDPENLIQSDWHRHYRAMFQSEENAPRPLASSVP